MRISVGLLLLCRYADIGTKKEGVMSKVETFIALGYFTAGLGFVGVGFYIKLLNRERTRHRKSARQMAISSALGSGSRLVLSAGVIGGYPYRVAVGGQVFGFVTLSGALEFMYEAVTSESVPKSAVPVHHPSLTT